MKARRPRRSNSRADEQLSPSTRGVQNVNDKYNRLVEVNKDLAESLVSGDRAAKRAITKLETKILKLEGDFECLSKENYCLAKEIRDLKEKNEALNEQNQGFLEQLEGLCDLIQIRPKKK
ncbi:hypothetical protein GL218_05632 [Daldinia childiae]|uniref:uncharacterized protein n=1 Tax=Daldinia childiae TaxID=326645 RepID=UPI001447D8C1|nr:uncharacterized protein GL218_05632 [Daldinia childiae]KAF3058667.1 hypothetical protein GL218_05632 [Daldinia childiae]